jgi:putative transposase
MSYLHGLSTGDFGPTWEQFPASGAGLSATRMTRLTSQWQDEARAFGQRGLSGTDYVYLWVDGIRLKVRLAKEKLCLLVMIGWPQGTRRPGRWVSGVDRAVG